MRDTGKKAERLVAIRLRYCINTHLDEQGIATPAGLAQATGLPATEAAGLLRRKQWREGDLAALQVDHQVPRQVPQRGGLRFSRRLSRPRHPR